MGHSLLCFPIAILFWPSALWQNRGQNEIKRRGNAQCSLKQKGRLKWRSYYNFFHDPFVFRIRQWRDMSQKEVSPWIVDSGCRNQARVISMVIWNIGSRGRRNNKASLGAELGTAFLCDTRTHVCTCSTDIYTTKRNTIWRFKEGADKLHSFHRTMHSTLDCYRLWGHLTVYRNIITKHIQSAPTGGSGVLMAMNINIKSVFGARQ
jgi:hypothetical protein